ncbi:MAG TPA: CAP domain-containing protein [Acidimicrobiales bacterium]|nr:CAP domain-containing protein [Acidimicrobiales bacterium]
MNRLVKGMLVLVLVLAGAAASLPASAVTADEQSFVTKLNDLRASKGVARLAVDARLTDIARAWSTSMASTNVLAHNPSYAAQAPAGWTKLGENVGYGYSVQSIHDALVASPGHYANMVDPAFNAVGIGVAYSGSKIWVTQSFMKNANVVVVSATALPTSGTDWYRLVAAGGETRSYGAAGALAGVASNSPVVAISSTASGAGAWMAAADGAVFAEGDAGYYGSMGGKPLSQPIVGMAATPTGNGYWLVARDGGVFSFGDAAFFGSTGNIRLSQPIVGMTASPTGKGYWFVAADGGIFAFGDAAFKGSTGAMRLAQPVVGMAATKSGEGYWLVARDGGIFSFGDAAFFGSTGSIRLNQPIVGMARSATGNGYRFVAADGGIFSFGDAAFLGSASGTPLASAITAIVAAAV